ncbi:PPC domain-containing DNA-binding protein [Thermoflexibacter ruber]|nr:PPC domain-containing DNA-binding protein [Thermoflexibacter ruber]
MLSSSMQVSVIRLRPMEDLKKSLENFVKENQIKAGIVLTCVGSLQASHLRLANQPQGTTFEGKQEIVSLVGTLATSGSHLHLSISDSTGKTIGGHLLEGCLVYTTAEIAIGILPQLRFTRELDTISTYKELKVYPK